MTTQGRLKGMPFCMTAHETMLRASYTGPEVPAIRGSMDDALRAPPLRYPDDHPRANPRAPF